MEDALVKMQATLLEARYGVHSPVVTGEGPKSPSDTRDTGDRLAHLKELRDKGLISQDEYDAKRKAILDSL